MAAPAAEEIAGILKQEEDVDVDVQDHIDIQQVTEMVLLFSLCWSFYVYFFSLSLLVQFYFSTCPVDCLIGLVVKASTLRAEDPGFKSRLQRDFFGVESYQ